MRWLGGAVARGLACAVAALGGSAGGAARASPSVWVIDDGEKVRRDATATPFERGEMNPVWQPGQPARAFALRQESIAFQVVVEADDAGLDGVTVELAALDGPGGAHFDGRALSRDEALRRVGRPIETFVEHFVPVRRASGGNTPRESLGWEAGSGPPPRAWVGAVPDALVPVEVAPPWLPYPMRVEPRSNGIVWIDVNVPVEAAPGLYRGTIEVRAGARSLASVPVEVDVASAVLPARSGATVYADPDELSRRVGPGAEEHLWKLLHAHRVATLHDATGPDDIRRHRAALDGSLFEPARGYEGPGRAAGDGVLSLGAYGGLGDADAGALERLADAVGDAGLFGRTQVFVYADDEDCASPRGAAWSRIVRGSANANVRRVRVAWTCSEDPAGQVVDIPVVGAASYDASLAAAAHARGKDVWVYNGVLPHTGAFLIDVDAVSPRVNGWLAAMSGVPRWFYWEATYWYGLHGKTPFDPFADAESFHNRDGDWANGDGVLVYPGQQVDAFREHWLGFDGVVPTIRLKNWRRGLEDGAYLELARERDPRAADAIARALVPAAFQDARRGEAPSFERRGQAFFEARRALRDIATGSKSAPATSEPSPTAPVAARSGFAKTAGGVAILAGALFLVAVRWRRARARP